MHYQHLPYCPHKSSSSATICRWCEQEKNPMTDEAPKRIGLIADWLGSKWALAHKDEAHIAVHYVREDTIAALTAERNRLYSEVSTLTTCGPAELAVRNPSLMEYMEYMEHWEGRAERAEKENSALTAERDALREALDCKLAHIQKLEDRIRRQRTRLHWWEDGFMRRGIISNRRYGWTASRVCALLRRLGSPHRVDADGRESRRALTDTEKG